jgi:hypothetical protein
MVVGCSGDMDIDDTISVAIYGLPVCIPGICVKCSQCITLADIESSLVV